MRRRGISDRRWLIFTVRAGDINTLVHLWTFENAGDRAERPGAMMRDPEWQNYLKLADKAGYLVEQRNSLMVPASFAPIKR